MLKKNRSNLFKKLFCVFLLSFGFFISSFCLSSSAATLVNSVSSGYYRINANSHIAYEALLKEYTSETGYDGTRSGLWWTPFELYDVEGNKIFDTYTRESEQYSFGFSNYVGYFYFFSQKDMTTYYSYFDVDKEGSKWYYIYFPNDPVASDWRSIGGVSGETIFNIMFNGTSLGFYDDLLVKTELGEDLPNEDEEYDIPSGTYKFNYGFGWPLLEELELSGVMNFPNDSLEYSILRVSKNAIYALSKGTNPTSKYLYENGCWLVDDPTFSTSGLFVVDDLHNGASSFLSQVNGNGYGDTGLVLEDKVYKFKNIISYPFYFDISGISFKTGDDKDLTFTVLNYNLNGTLSYGVSSGSDIVFSNNLWTYEYYKNFYMPGIVSSYKLGSFLSQNLDFGSIDKTFLLKGYYYFNSSIELSDLQMISDINKIVFISNGNIYNTMVYKYEPLEHNPTMYAKITFKYTNTSTIGSESLIDFSFFIPDYESLNSEFPTISSARQIYISPTYVDQETYNWFLRNGAFIYYQDEVADFPMLIGIFPDVIVGFMSNLMSFDIFGVNLFTAISSLITVLVAVWIIRKIL